ncbi:hypothetical protein JOQ06_023935 [Pogonophryne albipinna]|uniref:Uncharacterized protein n=1 Tax=Pogonophryne albipinna TaxID=1090488 RepID=A0AAD6BL75_9TELE|nr:hypothetical protein JOQ06_023935 [Pogonophryne albipinna]
MDIILRYWSEREGKVAVRYFTSEFLGHTPAEKLLESINRSLSPLDPKKLLQISMDGPTVNWKFLRIFQEDKSKEDPDAPKLINLGSCGLHVVHGSFQTGERETVAAAQLQNSCCFTRGSEGRDEGLFSSGCGGERESITNLFGGSHALMCP